MTSNISSIELDPFCGKIVKIWICKRRTRSFILLALFVFDSVHFDFVVNHLVNVGDNCSALQVKKST